MGKHCIVFNFDNLSKDSCVGVALIGAGRIGAVHLRNMLGNPRLDVRWIVDVDENVSDIIMISITVTT